MIRYQECPHCHAALPETFVFESCPHCQAELNALASRSSELSPPNSTACWLIFWFAFVLGPVLAWLTLTSKQPQYFFLPIGLGALISGIALARRFSDTIASLILKSMGFTVLVGIIYLGICFIGCLAVMSQA